MEMEGRSCSDFYRNTSEELFIKTMMESPVGMPAPTMEMLGFKNLTQNFRADSEELFKSWLKNGENNGCHSTGTAHRPPRQASRMISTELATSANPNGKKPNDETLFPQNTTTPPPPPPPIDADSSNGLNSTRSGVDKGLQASNLFLAKAWFHSSQPMTRSRSSELRKRYIAMQNTQTPIGIEAIYEEASVETFKQEPIVANGFNNASIYESPNQLNAFASPSNSSSSTFKHGDTDNISSVVSMLKGTLERKRMTCNQLERETDEGTSFGYYNTAVELLNQGQGMVNNTYENCGDFQGSFSSLGVQEMGVLQTIEESLMEGLIGPQNPTVEPSQSESSGAPHYQVVSNVFDMCDDQSASTQAREDCSRSKDSRERIYDNSKEDKKQKGGLIRYGSVTSAGSVDRGDPTKKRRVERSRKMAEAKERSSTPTIPSDMQSILKRCENLEKEVRSLKLNLSFMNRKDSEQTKQIEELQKQNEDLGQEKERLLQEIERIIVADTVKM